MLWPASALPILRRSSKLRASPLLNSTCGPSPGSGGVLQKRLGTVGVTFVTAYEECSSSAPCSLGACAVGRVGQMGLGRSIVQVKVRVRLWALGSYSCFHCTTKLTK